MADTLKFLLIAVFFPAFVAVCHAMNDRFNARFEDLGRKLQDVRTASLEVHEADRNLMVVGRSDPAALEAFEQTVERLSRAQAVADADRFPRRPKPGAPETG